MSEFYITTTNNQRENKIGLLLSDMIITSITFYYRNRI